VKGSIKRYCSCTDPATGRQYTSRCPKLANSKHGQWGYRDRLATSAGVKPFQRRGFTTKTAAETFRSDVYALLALARGDEVSLTRLGDLIFEKTKRGGHLPAVEDVRRRLGLGGSLDRTLTMRDAMEQWYAAKKRAKRDSTLRGWRQHLDHYLIPQLGDFPIDRCGALHISDLFDLIEEWNQEIEAARAEARKPVLQGDQRKRSKHVGNTTQNRILDTLNNFYGWAMRCRPTPLIDYNPCLQVELAPERHEPARTWDPEQVATFLEYAEDDPLYWLFRLVLIHGPRRGEAVGARRAAYDFRAKALRVTRPLLQLGGKLVESIPKTDAGDRTLWLDDETNDGIHGVLVEQARRRLEWGPAYVDHDLIWCWEDGTPFAPDYVSRRFRELAAGAGLPVIKLHEGRHTAATLRLEAGIDVKIVSEQMGHATEAITRNLYQHVRRAVLDKATAQVVELLPRTKRRGTEAAG
jgi:integrase